MKDLIGPLEMHMGLCLYHTDADTPDFSNHPCPLAHLVLCKGESSMFHIYILTVNEVKRAEVNACPPGKYADSAVLCWVLNITKCSYYWFRLQSNWEFSNLKSKDISHYSTVPFSHAAGLIKYIECLLMLSEAERHILAVLYK